MLPGSQQKNRFWRVFALCTLMAGCMFLPFVILDKGFFLVAGDFNSQQIPFSYHINQFLEEGGGSFDWATDLGSGFVNSYSFYLLGSPFFWLASLLPAGAQPYLMVPLLMLKFGTAGGGAYLWLRRWVQQDNYAVAGGALYAFSGFSIYNIFFNHFLDVVALFPFLLWALDATVLDRRRGLLPPIVALNLLVNYFFFAGQIVFLCLYFVCMLSCRVYRLRWRLFWQLAFECLLGCAIGCFLAFPALLSLQHNPRTFKFADGSGLLLYGKPQQYVAILASLFFPPDPTYLPTLFEDGVVVKWTSLSAYLPAVGFAGALCYLRFTRGTAWRRLLAVCGVFALVPVLNSSFYLFNSSYYARWYYMPVLILCGATVWALEHASPAQLGSSVRMTAFVTLAYVAFALVPDKQDDEWVLGIVESQGQFWLGLGLALLGLWMFWREMRLPGPRARRMTALALLCGCLVGIVNLSLTKFPQWEADSRVAQMCYREAPALEWPEGAYRTDSYGCYDNLSLWMDRPCLRFFNSTVAPSIMEFYPSVGVKRDVNSKPDIEQNALRGFLGVEYLLCDVQDRAEYEEKGIEGWTYYDEQGQFVRYHNENALPLGFAYDYYVTEETFEKTPESARALLLCKALVLDEEQLAQYGHLLAPLPEEELRATDYKDYQAAVADRRAMGCTAFEPDRSGFTARFELAEENLLFFTVPYDEGFTAMVNGEEAPVLNASHGMMAVPAPAGACEVRLTYRTPGLRPALAVSAAALAVYAVYLCFGGFGKRRPAAPEPGWTYKKDGPLPGALPEEPEPNTAPEPLTMTNTVHEEPEQRTETDAFGLQTAQKPSPAPDAGREEGTL